MEHHRRSIRLPGYDYSQPNAYFVTICAFQRRCLFGEIIDGDMQLNEVGRIVQKDWINSAIIRKEIILDEWVIMPNHFHAIISFVGAHGNAPFHSEGIASFRSNQPMSVHLREGRAHYHAPLRRWSRSLSTLIAGFKRVTTMNIRRYTNDPLFIVWQRNYHERIIRSDRELIVVREYIRFNPAKWESDEENSGRVVGSSRFP